MVRWHTGQIQQQRVQTHHGPAQQGSAPARARVQTCQRGPAHQRENTRVTTRWRHHGVTVGRSSQRRINRATPHAPDPNKGTYGFYSPRRKQR